MKNVTPAEMRKVQQVMKLLSMGYTMFHAAGNKYIFRCDSPIPLRVLREISAIYPDAYAQSFEDGKGIEIVVENGGG